jgi:cobalt-zinc-cadmium efflux system protein
MGLFHAHDHDHDHRAAPLPAEAGSPREARPRRSGPRDAVLAGRRGLRIALAITCSFMVAEAIGGWVANSLALMADAAHMLTDAAALGLSLFAIQVAARGATERRSYGLLRAEILAALANGVMLVAISVGIFYEAYVRFWSPPAVDVPLLIGVASAGLVANIAAAAVLFRSHGGHINARAAYVHVLGDLLGSVGAVAAGAIMLATGWYAADPLISAIVGVLILVSAVKVLQQAVEILLEAVPAHIDLERLERELAAVEGVRSVHDLHVWTISSGIHLMTCHAVIGGHGDHHDVLERLSCLVRERFGIEHSTIQLECEDLSAREVGTEFCDRC